MWGKHDFETIFNSNYAMNIQYGVGKDFVSRERAYSIGVNADFGTRRKNITHAIPNYGLVRYKFEVYYYRQTNSYS